MPSQASVSTMLLNIMVDVIGSGPPHVLELWLWVSKGMLPVRYFRSTMPLFVSLEFHGDHKTVTILR